MYWGKSLDQCTNKFCSSPFTSALSFVKSDLNNTVRSGLKTEGPNKQDHRTTQRLNQVLCQKRSLKKVQPIINSPYSSSTNATRQHFFNNTNVQQFTSSKRIKTSIKKCQQKQKYLIPENNHLSKMQTKSHIETPIQKIHSPAKTVNTLESKPIKYDYYFSKESIQSKTSLIIHNPKNIKTQCSNSYIHNAQPYYLNNWQFNSNSKKINNSKTDQTNRKILFNSPNHTNLQSFKKSQSPNNIVRYQHNNQLPHYYTNISSSIFAKTISQIQEHQIERLNIEQSQRFNQGQFPTIRQENETYEQSKSLNDHQKQLNPTAYNQFFIKSQQKPVLVSISNSNQLQQQIQEETFFKIVPNIQSQFQPSSQDSSMIEGKNDGQNFKLSCQELLLQSQTGSKQEQKLQQIQIIQQNRMQKDIQYQAVQRRQLHQPSICIKIIENKLRGHAYQLSHSSNCDATSGYKQSIPSSDPQQNQSRGQITSRRQVEQFDSPFQSFSKSKKPKVNFKMQESVKMMSQNTDRFSEKSLINILVEDKQNQILKYSMFKKVNTPIESNLIHENLFKQVSNLAQNHSDRQFNCSIRKICDDKRVKTLIDHRKTTMKSILQESSSIAKYNTSQQRSNTIMSKYLSDDNFEGILSSRNNYDRDESTVIGRHTFQSTLTKLL